MGSSVLGSSSFEDPGDMLVLRLVCEGYLELDSVGLCGCCGQVDRECCLELDSVGL